MPEFIITQEEGPWDFLRIQNAILSHLDEPRNPEGILDCILNGREMEKTGDQYLINRAIIFLFLQKLKDGGFPNLHSITNRDTKIHTKWKLDNYEDYQNLTEVLFENIAFELTPPSVNISTPRLLVITLNRLKNGPKNVQDIHESIEKFLLGFSLSAQGKRSHATELLGWIQKGYIKKIAHATYELTLIGYIEVICQEISEWLENQTEMESIGGQKVYPIIKSSSDDTLFYLEREQQPKPITKKSISDTWQKLNSSETGSISIDDLSHEVVIRTGIVRSLVGINRISFDGSTLSLSSTENHVSPNQENDTPPENVPTPKPSEDIQEKIKLLKLSKNVIFEGVPGTGKTYCISQIQKYWNWPIEKRKKINLSSITLHPSTSYEDFIEGLRPIDNVESSDWLRGGTDASNIIGADKTEYFHVKKSQNNSTQGDNKFGMVDGFFFRVCARATNNPKEDFLILLDEINRCNIPNVLGDLLTTIERSKRAKWTDNGWDITKATVVDLPGSKRKFFVPDNIYVIGTMNTTDRSVAPLDSALRRRFAFYRLEPDFKGLNKDDSSTKAMIELNKELAKFGPDAQLGHSYLYDMLADLEEKPDGFTDDDIIRHHWEYHILPQLADIINSNDFDVNYVGTANKGVLDLSRIRITIGEKIYKIHNTTSQDAHNILNITVLKLESGEESSSGTAE